MTEFVLEFDLTRDQTLSSNVDLHRRVKAKRVKALREMAASRVRGWDTARYPLRVDVEVCYPTARRADPPNFWPTAKALMDGLTDVGLWPDDNSDIIPLTTFSRGPKSPKGIYRVRLIGTVIEAAPLARAVPFGVMVDRYEEACDLAFDAKMDYRHRGGSDLRDLWYTRADLADKITEDYERVLALPVEF